MFLYCRPAAIRRRRSTLLIIVPDHDTGGFAINGPNGRQAEAGDTAEPFLVNGNPVYDDDGNQIMLPDLNAGWTTGNHTAVDTLVWSRGPGSQHLGKAIDNTKIFEVMRDVMR